MSFGLPPLAGLVPRFKSFDPPQADLRFTTHKESKIRRGIPQRGTTHKEHKIRRGIPQRGTTHKESKIRRGIPQRGTTHKDYGIRREVPRSGKARPRRACPGEAFKRRRNLEPKSYF